MNVHISTHMKGFVSSSLTNMMMIIIIIIMTVYAATSIFFIPNFFEGAKAYAQEDNINNSTLILEDVRTIVREQQRDIASIRNTSSAEVEAVIQTAMSSSKLATQGAYTALSVFFLGIGLMIFGLKLTSKAAPQIGRSMTIMVWALIIPVIILIGLFQYGALTGNNPLDFFRNQEPFYVLSFLMYVPIGIVIYLILQQKGVVQDQAAHISKRVLEVEKLVQLKEKGAITEEEFQMLKAELLTKS